MISKCTYKIALVNDIQLKFVINENPAAFKFNMGLISDFEVLLIFQSLIALQKIGIQKYLGTDTQKDIYDLFLKKIVVLVFNFKHLLLRGDNSKDLKITYFKVLTMQSLVPENVEC